MRIPELTYPEDMDDRVFRGTEINLGSIAINIQAITMAGKGRPNEDVFAFSQSQYGSSLTAAVLDGAISRDASHVGKQALEKSDAGSAFTTLRLINLALGQHDLKGGAAAGTILRLYGPDNWRPEGLVSVAHVTDTWAMAELTDKTTRLLTVDQHKPFDGQALAVLSRVAEEKGISVADARHDPEVKEALAEVFRTRRNAPDGQGEGILNGDPNMDRYIHSASIPLFGVRRLLMGSDGVTLLRPEDLTDPGYRRDLFDLVTDLGVEGTVDYIHEQEAVTPPNPEHPRWSLHDDKTLIDMTLSY